MLLAKSLAGHDKGKLYYVVSEDEGFVYLVNGKTKLLENPKRKKLMHVQLIKKLPDEITEMNIGDDSDIRKLLKAYGRGTAE